MTLQWNSRVPNLPFQAHGVFFAPPDDHAGPNSCVAIQFPECSRQTLRRALLQAAKHNARAIIICDTQQQADLVAKIAARLLPSHRRMPIERALDGGWGPAT